jgi:dTDP-4-amino-4,6-dideoxy-D-galactose acyltransferase
MARTKTHSDQARTRVMEGYCRVLDWDSRFFGFRVARVLVRSLDPESLVAIRRWCESEAIRCLYFLAGSSDMPSVRLAAADGYDLVDLRVTLEAALDGRVPAAPPEQVRIEPAQSADLDALRAIARTSHRDSRFYADPRFDRDRCDRLYETWIEKSLRDTAGVVLVPRCDGDVAGYLACRAADDGAGEFTLVAVAAAFQRQRLGHALVRAGLEWLGRRGLTNVRVVTQGRNVAAQRLYQSCGFVTRCVELWYHRWFP